MSPRAEAATELAPPPPSLTARLAKGLFGSWFNGVLTLLACALLAWALPAMLDWMLFEARFSGNAEDCRAAGGACWALIADKYRLVLFGLYPADQHWRPTLALLAVAAALALSAAESNWRRPGVLVAAWLAALGLFWLLMAGGFGLAPVAIENWGGLPLTVMLSLLGIALALPLAVLLALGRRSRLPAMRVLATGYIELIRGVPLISLLFMASVMLPLFLPEGASLPKLARAQAALVLFAAAYLAEVVRAGLQAVPRGQSEAAAALGLGSAQTLRLVVLPQALTVAIPAMVNTFIGIFKDTALVSIIGLFDLLSSARAALSDPAWRGFPLEVYLVAAAIYFVFCHAMSRYSQRLERRLAMTRRQ